MLRPGSSFECSNQKGAEEKRLYLKPNGPSPCRSDAHQGGNILEIVRMAAVDAARMEMAFRVGKAAVFALAKRANDDWSETDMNAVLSRESLSIAADDYLDTLTRIRRRVRESIKREKMAA